MAALDVTGDHRRGKTVLFLIACGWAGAVPHWVEAGRSLFPAFALALLLGGYGLRTVLSFHERPVNLDAQDKKLFKETDWPAIDVLVAARDEELVLNRLVERLLALNYPRSKLKTWIINDGSNDRSPELLDELSQKFTQLEVIHRSRNAGGGKSGALNEALNFLEGDWLLILDADAQLDEDLLFRLIPFALKGDWSAVQLRKSVVNSRENLLTNLQSMEMAMDAVIQQGRLAIGGIVELRGNGQLINRKVLDCCGGFNEETVTDDLDLSFRLLNQDKKIGLLWNPPILEEAVETLPALWRQRQRWAEGGLQRFFDYWRLLISEELAFSKRLDLTCFFLLQYALPVVSFSDFLTTIVTRTMPTYWPLSIVAFSVSGLAYWRGCSSVSEGPDLPSPSPFKLLLAISYLAHWFVVIPWVTVKMAIFPKRLVWAKTSHQGH